MDNIKDNNYYLNKIIGYIEFILECTKDVSQEEFEKDEMDSKEKELIEFYDAFNHGYNGTSGNS